MRDIDSAPPWLVLTREVWDAAPQSSRNKLQIIASFKAFAYSDGLRTPEVMVVKKR